MRGGREGRGTGKDRGVRKGKGNGAEEGGFAGLGEDGGGDAICEVEGAAEVFV